MAKKTVGETLAQVADKASVGFFLEEGQLKPDTLFEFILAATTYGGWKIPLEIRDYQMKPAWDVVDSVVNRKGHEISAMFSRQSGKTTSISGATNFFLSAIPSFYKPYEKVGIRSGIFGPKKEQADYAFDMYKQFIDTGFLQDYFGVHVVLNNARELRLSNGSRMQSESASKNASIERLTLDLAILEEAQNIEDTRILNSIYPMCASTNGTRVLIGTPTPDRSGYFYRLTSRRGSHNHRADWRECARYSKQYESFVQKEMRRHGQTSDYFKTQYELEWSSNVVNFCTLDELSIMREGELIPETLLKVIGGLDTARITDSTILSIFTSPLPQRKPHLCFWSEWQGDDTKIQAEEISHILTRYPNLELLNIDTLHGIGHGIADLLPQHLPIARFPMERYRQSWMWQQLREGIVNQSFTYADVQTPERYKFEEQMSSLKTKYVGDILSVSAPPGRNDDYADSCALAWAGVEELYYISSDITSPLEVNKDNAESEKSKSDSNPLKDGTVIKRLRFEKPKPKPYRFKR